MVASMLHTGEETAYTDILGGCAAVVLFLGVLAVPAWFIYQGSQRTAATAEAAEAQRQINSERYFSNICQVIVYDGCQYLLYGNGVAHKGNCTNLAHRGPLLENK